MGVERRRAGFLEPIDLDAEAAEFTSTCSRVLGKETGADFLRDLQVVLDNTYSAERDFQTDLHRAMQHWLAGPTIQGGRVTFELQVTPETVKLGRDHSALCVSRRVRTAIACLYGEADEAVVLSLLELKLGALSAERAGEAGGPAGQALAYVLGIQIPTLERANVAGYRSLSTCVLGGRRLGQDAVAEGAVTATLVQLPVPEMLQPWQFECMHVRGGNSAGAAVVVMRVLQRGLLLLEDVRLACEAPLRTAILGKLPPELPVELWATPWSKQDQAQPKVSQGVLFRAPTQALDVLERLPGLRSLAILVDSRRSLQCWPHCRGQHYVLKFRAPLQRSLVSTADFERAMLRLKIKGVSLHPLVVAATLGASTVTLTVKLDGWRQLTPGDVKRAPTVLEDVLWLLSKALQAGVTHCDLRFGNIFISPAADRTVLLDFESFTPSPPSRQEVSGDAVQFPDSQTTLAQHASWQLCLLLFNARASPVEVNQQTYVEWLEEICKGADGSADRSVALFQAALAAETGELQQSLTTDNFYESAQAALRRREPCSDAVPPPLKRRRHHQETLGP